MSDPHPLDGHSPASRPSVRSASLRKLAKDGTSWTPTEQRKRDALMRQFTKAGKGVAVRSGNSPEYQEGWERVFGGKK